jgi:hypothetical protein
MNPRRAVVDVENFHYATSQLAQTTLRSVLGQVELDTLLSEREKLNQQLQTILGTVRLERAYYHCAQCPAERRGIIPKDHALDVVGTSFSPGLRRLMARVGTQEPFAAAEQDLGELAGVRVDTKTIERTGMR